MTNEELIKELRDSKGWPALGNAAADRIEQLLNDNWCLKAVIRGQESEIMGMNNLRIFTYLAVIFSIIVHHTPILRAGFEVQTDYYYEIMAKEIGLWE